MLWIVSNSIDFVLSTKDKLVPKLLMIDWFRLQLVKS